MAQSYSDAHKNSSDSSYVTWNVSETFLVTIDLHRLLIKSILTFDNLVEFNRDKTIIFLHCDRHRDTYNSFVRAYVTKLLLNRWIDFDQILYD